MTEIATVRVQILGREFPVACPAGQEHELEAAAEFVDNRMREIQEKTGNSALERLAVMAALNIAHEHLTGETKGSDDELRRLANQISATLERLSESETG
ncbi:MAG TPA: cell division protein ZapA [Gammaproteobacteria bacterium]|nr:cell division protein ZapA [Gammaproteobacteria bacterium]HBX26486.1 cell division protein ZapA [Gammaproteobacteria bacterium]|tara:strand:- start:133 stop:429 length:297 start_codon:yes stop_codon:yes gene_type:complete